MSKSSGLECNDFVFAGLGVLLDILTILKVFEIMFSLFKVCCGVELDLGDVKS